MKRDMNLICQLLAHVECKQTEGPVEIPPIQDYSEGQVHYHVGLCIEAGYIDAAKPYSAGRRLLIHIPPDMAGPQCTRRLAKWGYDISNEEWFEQDRSNRARLDAKWAAEKARRAERGSYVMLVGFAILGSRIGSSCYHRLGVVGS